MGVAICVFTGWGCRHLRKTARFCQIVMSPRGSAVGMQMAACWFYCSLIGQGFLPMRILIHSSDTLPGYNSFTPLLGYRYLLYRSSWSIVLLVFSSWMLYSSNEISYNVPSGLFLHFSLYVLISLHMDEKSPFLQVLKIPPRCNYVKSFCANQ
jgi:hypothetical protein